MRTTVVVNGDTMGRGSDELGATLVGSFLRKLAQAEPRPVRMIFYNSGVRLLADGSNVLDAVGHLADGGVDIVACGTCVEYYGLKESLRVGRVGSMDGILADLMRAEKVVTI